MTHLLMVTHSSSHKQKVSFPQEVSTVDQQNPAANHSQKLIKIQEVETYDSYLVTVMSPFNVNRLFIYDSSN